MNSISVTLSEKNVNFSKVFATTDEMVTLLEAVQSEDDSKKAYCSKLFDGTEDEAKMLARQIANHKDATLDYKYQLSNTDARIEVAKKSIDEAHQQRGGRAG